MAYRPGCINQQVLCSCLNHGKAFGVLVLLLVLQSVPQVAKIIV
jgi:hypothetical protein